MFSAPNLLPASLGLIFLRPSGLCYTERVFWKVGKVMAVTFVRPQWPQVVRSKKDGRCYRIIGATKHYQLGYCLPERAELLALCGGTDALLTELTERYLKWLAGDKQSNPLLFFDGMPPRFDLSTPESLFMALAQSTNSPWLRLGSWQLTRIYPDPPHEAPAPFILASDCESVTDPVAPLLHTHQNRWERIKSRELNALMAPLDLVKVGAELSRRPTYLNDLSLRLGMPSFTVEYLLHLYCLFGGTKEGLSYAQELLTPKAPLSLDDGRTWAQSFWQGLYRQLTLSFASHQEQWEEAVSSYGASLINAMGGARFSLLHALKQHEAFKPTWADFLSYKRGVVLSHSERNEFGINPNYGLTPAPLPLKAGLKLPALQQAELDNYYMGLALEQAVLAYRRGEVPVGAVVVAQDESLAQVVVAASNSTIADHDPSAHAEVLALRAAGKALANYRLSGATLYVTLEPCCMCAMASIHARVDRIVYGASDPRTGACGSVFALTSDARHNHKIKVEGGVRAQECAQLLKRFFAARRS